jgi:hypothetical protein
MPDKFDSDLLRQLLEQARDEMNPDKLIALIKQINDLYDLKSAAQSRFVGDGDIEKLD